MGLVAEMPVGLSIGVLVWQDAKLLGMADRSEGGPDAAAAEVSA